MDKVNSPNNGQLIRKVPTPNTATAPKKIVFQGINRKHRSDSISQHEKFQINSGILEKLYILFVFLLSI